MASLMEELLDVLGKEEKQYQELITLASEKTDAVVQGNIEHLLKQALEMVEFDLTLLRSTRQAPETANYDKNAYNTGDILGSSGFDAKQ